MKSQKMQQQLKRRLESKELPPEERIIQEPRTIENTKIKNPLEICDQNDQEIQDLMQTDEFASYFGQPLDYKPKVLITSSKNATKATIDFIEALVDLVPNSKFVERGPNHLMKEIVEGAIERSYTAIVVIGESNKVPGKFQFIGSFCLVFFTMINLPDGPTAYFKLSSIQLSKQIYNHGNSTDHNPELILNNFTTHLGFTVGRFFASLFPKSPQFRGRQVVTFHNQRDFVFIRRHRYKIDEGNEIREAGERVDLQEIGPKFSLKLIALQHGTHDKKEGNYIWERRPEKEEKKKFYL